MVEHQLALVIESLNKKQRYARSRSNNDEEDVVDGALKGFEFMVVQRWN